MLENARECASAKFAQSLAMRRRDFSYCAAIHNVPPALSEDATARGRHPSCARETSPRPRHPNQTSRAHRTTSPRSQAYPKRRSAASPGRARRHRTFSLCRCSRMMSSSAPSPSTARKSSVHRQADRAGKNFANQAVIAIENTRLLNELREILAAADRHRRSAQGHQPLDLRSAAGLRHHGRDRGAAVRRGLGGHLMRQDGELSVSWRSYGVPPEFAELRQRSSVPTGPRIASLGRAVLEQAARSRPRCPGRSRVPLAGRRSQRMRRFDDRSASRCCAKASRSASFASARQHGPAIHRQADRAGHRPSPTRPSSPSRTRGCSRRCRRATRELTESLEHQTATSEVLEVISRSPTDLQPVLDTIVETAARLCGARHGAVFRLDATAFRMRVARLIEPRLAVEDLEQLLNPDPGRGSACGACCSHGKTVHIPDVLADPDYRASRSAQGSATTARISGVPMLRDGDAYRRRFSLRRHEVRPFTDKQIELVETFADQAVIAIENTRLFEEVQARNAELRVQSELRPRRGRPGGKLHTRSQGRARRPSSTRRRALRHRWRLDLLLSRGGRQLRTRRDDRLDEELVATFRKLDIAAGRDRSRRGDREAQPVQISGHLTKRPSNPLRDAALEAGFRAALIVPLLQRRGSARRADPAAPAAWRVSARPSSACCRRSPTNPRSPSKTPACSRRSRKRAASLEIASQHKSQFVANMSHELQDAPRRHPRLRRADAGRLLRASSPRNRWMRSRASAPTASTCWASSTPCSTSPRSNPASSA